MNTKTNAKTKTKIRELRRILGLTQGKFATLIGASKDTIASWDTGRNPLSPSLARRIALVTGVDERSLLRPEGELRVKHGFPPKRYTLEEFQLYRKRFWGHSAEENVRRQWRPCADTLEVVFLAAATGNDEAEPTRLSGVVDSFIQWCRQTREEFGLGPAIEAELAKRKGTLELTHSYGQWREMAKEDPTMARMMGFKDNPKRRDEESLTLKMENVPEWMPGTSMRGAMGKRT
jgi:transcriptional regulator with XRE-family HTH domain